MIRQFTTTSKIIMLSVTLVAFTSTIVGAIFYYGNNQNVSHHAATQLSHKIDTLKVLLEERLNAPLRILEQLAKSEEIKKVSLLPNEHKEKLKFQTQLLFAHNKNFKEIIIALKEKNTILKITKVDENENAIETKEYSESLLPQFEKNSQIQVLNPNEKGEVIAQYTTPIKMGKTLIGHLYLSKNINLLMEQIKIFNSSDIEFSIVNNKTQYIMKGEYITPFNSALPTILKDFPELNTFFTGKGKFTSFPKTIFYPFQALHVIKLYAKNSENPLISISGIIKYEQQIKDFDIIRKKTIITSVLMIILAAILSVIMSKYLTKGLMAITAAAKEYMDGNENIQLPVDNSHEISLLANTFQGMIHRVNERTRRIKRSEEKSIKAKEQAEAAQLSAEEARLQAEEATYQKGLLLSDLQKQKEHIEKISKDKDDLMAIVSHDLKNPLAVIESSVDLIRDTEKSLSPESIELLMRAHASAHFAINLITDLLDLARLEGGIKLELEQFSVHELFMAAIYAHELPAKDKRIQLTFDVPKNYSLMGDYTRILQILNNLIGNAIKFTPPNGTIHLAGVQDKNDPQNIHITLQDNGRGIPESKVAKIFDKYEQAHTNDRKTGTGLGLAICQQIAQMHNGKIYVESEEGKGSCFHLQLPGLETKNAFNVIELNNSTRDSDSQTSIKVVNKILLIDDSEDIEALIRMMLAGENIEFDWAADGRSGVLAYMKGKHDLILMDLNMPVMNGLKTTQIIRALEQKTGLKHADILAITASSDEESKRQCIIAGCNGTLNKPIRKETLLKAIGRSMSLKKAA